MRILITGATGFIGRHLVQALASQNHVLVLTSRTRSMRDDHHDWRIIDFSKAQSPDDWQDLVRDVDIVINAVGIFKQTRTQSFEALHDKAPRALFEASKRAGVHRIIQMSALGTNDGATSPYHLSKKRADDALAGLGVDWVVLRPSLIIGSNGESWTFFKALASLPLVPVIGDGRQIIQPVAIGDVVKAVLAAIERPQGANSRINIVGAQSLTLERYLQTLSKWMGRTSFRAVYIPYTLAKGLAAIAGFFVDMPLSPSAIRMLQEARYHDDKACPEKLGFSPRGVSAFLAQDSANKQSRVAAKLYFLGPLLRLSLAFMWIMAGVVSLFFYPQEQSLALLAKLGFTGTMGMLALYGAAFLDILLGLSLLMQVQIKKMAVLQIGLIVVYTLALSWAASGLWSDPFGPLVKNIPIIAAILIMKNLEEQS